MDARLLAGLALMALVPVVLYAMESTGVFVYGTVVNVVIIAASVYLMLGPAESGSRA